MAGRYIKYLNRQDCNTTLKVVSMLTGLCPDNRAEFTCGRITSTHDLPAVVDHFLWSAKLGRRTDGPPERPQIGHDFVLPEPSMELTLGGLAVTYDLPVLVDGNGIDEGSPQRPQVDYLIFIGGG
jgi:hypothetical protein